MSKTLAALDTLGARLLRTESIAAIALVILELLNELDERGAIGLGVFIGGRGLVKAAMVMGANTSRTDAP